MKIRFFVAGIITFITVMLTGLMFGSVWLVLKLTSNYSVLRFRQEAKKLVSQETRIRSELVFHFIEESDTNTIIEGFDTDPLLKNVVLYNLAGSPVHPIDTLPPLIQEIKETELAALIEENMARNSLFFTYPEEAAESLSGDASSDATVIFFRILPDADRVIAVGSDNETILGSFREFENRLRRYSSSILLPIFFAVVFVAVTAALAAYFLHRRYIIKPLNQIGTGLCSLVNRNFSYRILPQSGSALQFIFDCYNKTASILESSHARAAQSEQQYRTLIENISEKVFLKNPDGYYQSCNSAFAADLKIRPQDIAGHTDFDFFPESLAAKYRRDDKRIISTGLMETFEEQYIQDGDFVWIQITKAPVFNQSDEIIGVLGIFFDMTKMKQQEHTIRDLNENLEQEVAKRTEELHVAYKKMEELSVTDSLTGLNNKRHFEDSSKLIVRRSRRYGTNIGILMADIDSFKSYNDCYGHVQGDEALRIVAECIHLAVNRPEDLAVRFGGEEFVILLTDVDTNGLIHVGEKLRKMVEARKIPHTQSDTGEYLTLSVGCALYSPSSSDSFETVLNRADTALYSAKAAGRNQLKVLE